MRLLCRGGGMVDAHVSKTCEPKAHAGSTPARGTFLFFFSFSFDSVKLDPVAPES